MIAISNTLTAPIRCKLRYCDGRKLSSADHGPLVAMQQIADWLKTLGLTQYAQAFADNDIDFSVLGYLTDQDLEISFKRDSSCAQLPDSCAERRGRAASSEIRPLA